MNKNIVITAVASAVGGAVAGGVLTYVTVNKKLRARYFAESEAAIESMRRHYDLLQSGHEEKRRYFDTVETPNSITTTELAGEELDATVNQRIAIGQQLVEQYGDPNPDGALTEKATRSIWDEGVTLNGEGIPVTEDEANETIYSSDVLLAVDDDGIPVGYERIDGEPHLISENFYFENPQEWELDTVIYYEVDDTLVDEKNNVIPDADRTIGGRHFSMFVRDRNKPKQSFYVRNENLETLFEVIMDEGSYSQEVLGVDPELLGLREPKQRPKKMREGDH